MILLVAFSISATQCTETAANDLQKSLEGEYLVEGAATEELGEEIVEGILFMREEEKVARDVYLYLYEIYPLRPFANIAKSEQAHMNAIKYLIDLYGLEDPVGEDLPGVFKNTELQELYDALIEQGRESKEAALKVGALIEEVDILDPENELEKVTEFDQITRVYTNLCKASGNHLRGFDRVLELNGVNYEPVKLEDDHFADIINQ